MNGVVGTIPTEFWLLTKLNSLKFYQNHLRGFLPGELGNLKLINLMATSRNGISGTVPSEFGQLINIRELYLQTLGWVEMQTTCAAPKIADSCLS